MDIRDRFWFWFGWALSDDGMPTESAAEIINEVGRCLGRVDAETFTKYALSFVHCHNDRRLTLYDLAFRLACYQIEIRDGWNQGG